MKIDLRKPIRLDRAAAWRTYSGGSLIEKLYGRDGMPDTSFPEDWIMSTVRARNAGREDIVEGLSMISGSDISLAELIEANPSEMLGDWHVEKFGKSLGVLVKIIDSAERLTVQVHPTRAQAKLLFCSDYGKTECWHILGGRTIDGEPPCIYLGFKEGITREEWKRVFDTQDIPAMLGCLHKFEVKSGDTFLIKGGVPHAIGAGCFLVEVQEPTDYTIRTERVTPRGIAVADFMCHQGLGFDRMFDCFDYSGASAEKILEEYHIPPRGEDILSYSDTEMFALRKIEIDGETGMESGGVFSGFYVLEGEGRLGDDALQPGSQYFIPAASEPFTISGKLTLIRFYGPKI